MKKNAGAASFKYKRHGMRMVPQRLEKVFETACAAEGAKSLQNRWEVMVCPNIVAQIGQHMAEDHCLQVRRDDAAGSTP